VKDVGTSVTLTGVSKRFGQTTVLDHVNLELMEGTTTAIVGESGSGKTTLLQLINGLLELDEGDIRVFGAPIPMNGREHFRRRIGYAVQGAGLFPHLTSFENVTLVARLEGWEVDRVQARFSTLLRQMGLPGDVSGRYPQQLSGGQQQRLGLCRALMLEPRLLLLDEPFSAVDPITRVGIYEQFEAVRASEGVTSVLVTHDMREAVRLAAQLVILRDGRVLQCAPTKQVVDDPADDYVHTLVSKQL
jgi:osmoprotectant transport system ATP-binding protein|tara:strand:- start:841 stop:1578 length:738 start_codon:yes stop_codon:yes gene_type:complete